MNSQAQAQGLDPQILAQFSELELPAPVGLWPLSWQLWCLLIFVTVIIFTCVFIFWKHRKKNQYRKLALSKLENIRTNPSYKNSNEAYQAANELLKNCMSHAQYERSSFYSQFGVQWYMHIYHSLPEKKRKHLAKFTDSFAKWERQSYDSAPFDASELNQFLTFCHLWIKHHTIQPRSANV